MTHQLCINTKIIAFQVMGPTHLPQKSLSYINNFKRTKRAVSHLGGYKILILCANILLIFPKALNTPKTQNL